MKPAWRTVVQARAGRGSVFQITVREQVIDLALEQPELSPRELAVTFIDTRGYFISEASVYRLMKAQDLFATPACRVMTAADEFTDTLELAVTAASLDEAMHRPVCYRIMARVTLPRNSRIGSTTTTWTTFAARRSTR